MRGMKTFAQWNILEFILNIWNRTLVVVFHCAYLRTVRSRAWALKVDFFYGRRSSDVGFGSAQNYTKMQFPNLEAVKVGHYYRASFNCYNLLTQDCSKALLMRIAINQGNPKVSNFLMIKAIELLEKSLWPCHRYFLTQMRVGCASRMSNCWAQPWKSSICHDGWLLQNAKIFTNWWQCCESFNQIFCSVKNFYVQEFSKGSFAVYSNASGFMFRKELHYFLPHLWFVVQCWL